MVNVNTLLYAAIDRGHIVSALQDVQVDNSRNLDEIMDSISRGRITIDDFAVLATEKPELAHDVLLIAPKVLDERSYWGQVLRLCNDSAHLTAFLIQQNHDFYLRTTNRAFLHGEGEVFHALKGDLRFDPTISWRENEIYWGFLRDLLRGQLPDVTIPDAILRFPVLETRLSAGSLHPSYFIAVANFPREGDTKFFFAKFYEKLQARDRDLSLLRFTHGLTDDFEVVSTVTVLHPKASHPYALIRPFIHSLSFHDYVERTSVLSILPRGTTIPTLFQPLHSFLARFHREGYARRHELPVEDCSYSELFTRWVADASTPLGTFYLQHGDVEQLDNLKETFPALVHGDFHPRNILNTKPEYFFLRGTVSFMDFEFAHVGLPQEDLTMLHGFRHWRRGEVGSEQAHLDDYLQRAGIANHDTFLHGYHLVSVLKELQICRSIVGKVMSYLPSEFQESYAYHRNRAVEQARLAGYSEHESAQLADTADRTFAQLLEGQVTLKLPADAATAVHTLDQPYPGSAGGY